MVRLALAGEALGYDYMTVSDHVVIPERIRGDLDDVPEDVRDAMRFHPVMSLGEVLEHALEPRREHALS